MNTNHPDWFNGQPKSLKALRMWHWRQVRHYRDLADRADTLKLSSATDWHALANLHLSAVQVLNDSVPGTAEQDCAEEDAHVRA